MDKTRKIRSQNIRKLDLKDSKNVRKMHSEKTNKKIGLLFHRGGNLFNRQLVTGDAETPVSLMPFLTSVFNLRRQM